MKLHGIDTNYVTPTNNLDIFISIPTNHISKSKIRDLDVQLRGQRYNPIYNFVEDKYSDIWIVINNLTNNPSNLHTLFYRVFHNVAQVNVFKSGNDNPISFNWVS